MIMTANICALTGNRLVQSRKFKECLARQNPMGTTL